MTSLNESSRKCFNLGSSTDYRRASRLKRCEAPSRIVHGNKGLGTHEVPLKIIEPIQKAIGRRVKVKYQNLMRYH